MSFIEHIPAKPAAVSPDYVNASLVKTGRSGALLRLTFSASAAAALGVVEGQRFRVQLGVEQSAGLVRLVPDSQGLFKATKRMFRGGAPSFRSISAMWPVCRTERSDHKAADTKIWRAGLSKSRCHRGRSRPAQGCRPLRLALSSSRCGTTRPPGVRGWGGN